LLEITPLPTTLLYLLLAKIPDNTRDDLTGRSRPPTFNLSIGDIDQHDSLIFSVSTSNSGNGFKPRFAIANFCSVVNKQAELEVFLESNKINLMIGTKLHLDDSIYSSEIFPRNYSVYRKDRNIHGGGVFVLIENPYHHQY